MRKKKTIIFTAIAIMVLCAGLRFAVAAGCGWRQQARDWFMGDRTTIEAIQPAYDTEPAESMQQAREFFGTEWRSYASAKGLMDDTSYTGPMESEQQGREFF